MFYGYVIMKKTLLTILAAAALAAAFSGCASTKKSKASKSKSSTESTAAADSTTATGTSSASSGSSSAASSVKKLNYVDYDSQEKAESSAGFKLNVPSSLPFSYTKKITRAIPNDMVEIIYTTDDSAAYIDKVGTAGSSTTVNNSANKSGSASGSGSASAGSSSSSGASGSSSTLTTGNGDEVRLRKAKGSDDISGDVTKYLITKNMAANRNKADSKRVELRGEVNNYHVATWTDGGYTYAITSKKGLTEQQILAFADQLY